MVREASSSVRLPPIEVGVPLAISAQPDDATCGPTCLHAVYRHFGLDLLLPDVVTAVDTLWHGGTLGVHLARHACAQGMRVRLYTYNLRVFDPTWFQRPATALPALLAARAGARPEYAELCDAYRSLLADGGEIRYQPLDGRLIRRYLKRELPLITGVSATYLYGAAREDPASSRDDDVAGDPAGHFVVLCGYDRETRRIRVADPYRENPLSGDHFYEVEMNRLIGAILLGVLTHDANFLVVRPRAPQHR